jgi:arsenical pump membrane protein
MSLDTTAVILTPVVVSAVQRLKLPARPYVLLCAFIANFASLLLPVSNLTNLLYAGAFGLSFGAYTLRMILPQAAALAATYGALRLLHGRQLSERFDENLLPAPETEIRNAPYFRCCRIVLAVVLAGYFAAPLLRIQPFAVGFCGCVALALAGVRYNALPAGLIRHISWSVVPFVVGLFVLVQAVENCGAVETAMRRVAEAIPGNPVAAAFSACLGSAVLSNLVNNLPAGLISIGLLRHAHAPFAVLGGSLVGTNIGPGVTVFGSLATILVVDAARRRGEDVHAADLLRDGALVTPLAAIAAVAVLAFESALIR